MGVFPFRWVVAHGWSQDVARAETKEESVQTDTAENRRHDFHLWRIDEHGAVTFCVGENEHLAGTVRICWPNRAGAHTTDDCIQ